MNFDEWSSEYMVCTDFAAAYKRANPHAIIKFGKVEGDGHAWIYDPELGRTIDATLSQWAGFKKGCEQDDWWPGDEHPVADEQKQYQSVEAFAKDEGGTYLLR